MSRVALGSTIYRRAMFWAWVGVMRKGQKYPQPRAIYVDVDGTLLIDGRVNLPLVHWLWERQKEGWELYLWSSKGREYAATVLLGSGAVTSGLFRAVLPKPAFIADDQGWEWIKYTRTLDLRLIAENKLVAERVMVENGHQETT